MRIDPSRLSRLLLALSQKPDAAKTDATRGDKQAAREANGGRGATRDIKVLRKDMQSRLRTLDPQAADHDTAATSIAIQEILRWEFGQDILEHPDFHRIAASIAETMLQDAKMAASLRKLVDDLARA
jgi:CHAD domain-containing protein